MLQHSLGETRLEGDWRIFTGRLFGAEHLLRQVPRLTPKNQDWWILLRVLKVLETRDYVLLTFVQ